MNKKEYYTKMYNLSQYLILLKQNKKPCDIKKNLHTLTIYFIIYNFVLAYNSELKIDLKINMQELESQINR